MDINLDNLNNTEKLNQTLEDNEKTLRQFQNSYEKLIDQQEKIFADYINKVAPVLNHIINNGYPFSHPTIDFTSILGPILDYDQEKNLLYIWDIKDHMVNEINMYKQDDKRRILLNQFVRFANFENAITGILHCLQLQSELIKSYQEEIDKKERIIAKYENI